MTIRGRGGRVKRVKEKEGRRGKVKARKGKKRCRQVCDLFKELEGSRGRRWRVEGRGVVGVVVVAMAMTWNAHVAPGNGSLAISPHRLMDAKPRPVPPQSVTDSGMPAVGSGMT